MPNPNQFDDRRCSCPPCRFWRKLQGEDPFFRNYPGTQEQAYQWLLEQLLAAWAQGRLHIFVDGDWSLTIPRDNDGKQYFPGNQCLQYPLMHIPCRTANVIKIATTTLVEAHGH